MKLGGTFRGISRRRVAREGRGAGIDHADEIGPRRNLRQRIVRIAVVASRTLRRRERRRGEFGAGGEPHDPDFRGIEFPLRRMSAHQADGLKGIVHGVGLGVVAVHAQTIPQDDGRDPCFLKNGTKVAPFRADPQDLVSAAGGDDHGRAGVRRLVADQVHLDRRVVDVEDVQRFVRLVLEHVL